MQQGNSFSCSHCRMWSLLHLSLQVSRIIPQFRVELCRDFQQDAQGGPSRAAASARDVPEGLVLVLGNAFACPGSGCGAGCDLAEPQRWHSHCFDQSPRPDVISENPDFPLPGVLIHLQRSRVPEFPKAADFPPFVPLCG